MKYFFTADEHYGHKNIIKYCNRPFKSIDKMDAVLIKNHNQVVSDNDIVFHVGDFTTKRNSDAATDYIMKLNGQHVFIRGNHDNWLKDLELKLPYIREKRIDKNYIVMCHYPMITWPRSNRGSLLAYGHSHGKLPPYKNSYDVGVDNNNFFPVSLDDFLKKIST